jgi:hypothetical protein
MNMTRRTRFLLALTASLVCVVLDLSYALGLGSTVIHDAPLNPFNIDQLPPDVGLLFFRCAAGAEDWPITLRPR